MTTEQGSQAYRLIQQLNAGASPPDHEGTIRFMALLLAPICRQPGERRHIPRHV